MSGIPSVLTPGEEYDVQMDVEVTSGNPFRGGFQVVALRDANNTQAGIWSNPDAFSSLKTSNGRVYFGHQPARNFGGNDVISWEANWEAPDITDDITFYMVGLIANGNGSTSGDLVVTDQFTASVMSVENLDITFSNIIGVSCSGDDDGSATANVSGGVPPYDYAWDNGESGSTANNLDGGNHSLTITDDNGDSETAIVFIPEPSELEIDAIIENISCNGLEDGFIELDISGGTGAYTCEWEELDDDCIQEDLEAGVYFVTVSDENDCTASAEIEILEPDEITLDLSSTMASAANNDGTASCSANGGIPPYQFSWSNGVVTNGLNSTITGLSQGVYTVTVSDSNGCDKTGSVNVAGITCNVTINLLPVHIACNGDLTGSVSVVVNNAAAPVSYLWSDSSTGTSINNIPAGEYSLTVTDSNSCSAVDTVFVTEPDSLFIDSLQVFNPLCPGDDTGLISFIPKGGTKPYSINWSNGVSNDTMIVGMDTIVNIPDTLGSLLPGSYSFTITDSNSCMLFDSIDIISTDNQAPLVEPIILERFLNENGIADAVSINEILEFISDNCEISSIEFDSVDFDCDDTGTNSIALSVSDNSQNITNSIIRVNVFDNISPDIECNNVDIDWNRCDPIDYMQPSATDNCGIASINLTAGLASGEIFPAGETRVEYTATDFSGNSSICDFIVRVESNIEVQSIVENASCLGDDGSIILIVNGGTPPYAFNPSILNNLTPGTYNITISDAASCEIVETVVVDQDEVEIISEITTSDASCFGEADGSVNIDIQGDPDDFEIEFETGINPDALAAGNYSVTISDIESNCRRIRNFQISEPDELQIIDYNLVTEPCSGVLLDFELFVQGGTAPYTENAVVNGSELVLMVSDANACEASIMETLQLVSQELRVDSIRTKDVIDTPGEAEIFVSGGVPPYTYQWTDSGDNIIGTGSSIDMLPAGTYFIQISDAAGCVLDKIEVFIDFIQSTEFEESSDIILYPNPANTQINIEHSFTGTLGINILDISGRVCLNTQSPDSKTSIDISELSPGLYIVEITNSTSRSTVYFVKH